MSLRIFIILALASCSALAREAPGNMKEFNKLCPFKEHYIAMDRAYHDCAHGFGNARCDVFLEELHILLPEYDCQRSFDSNAGKNHIVPAIWLAGSGAIEDFYSLLYKLASNDTFFNHTRFKTTKSRARVIFLSPEFRNTLDGHVAQEYFPRIESMRLENP